MSKKTTNAGLVVPPPPSRQRADFARMETVTKAAASNIKDKKL